MIIYKLYYSFVLFEIKEINNKYFKYEKKYKVKCKRIWNKLENLTCNFKFWNVLKLRGDG